MLDATRLPVGRIVGQFALVTADNEDVGWEPQFTGVTGKVTLTCSATPPLRFTDNGKTIIIIPEPVEAMFDGNGNIIGVGGEPLTVLATDSTKLNPHGFTWKISFDLMNTATGRPVPIPAYEFQVPEYKGPGGEVDVAAVAPLGSAGGTLITRGVPGHSAYEVAVQEGFVGTVSEWLASLVGPPGDAEGIVLNDDPRLSDARTPVAHDHVIGDVTGLQDALDSVSVEVTWADVTGKPATYAPSAHQHAIGDTTGLQAALDAAGEAPAWSEVTGKPATFTPSTHGHPMSEVTGLDTALSGKQASGDYATNSALTSGLAGKANSTHTHAIGDTTGLQAVLDGKQASGSYAPATHSHAIADTTGLQAALDSKSTLELGTTSTTAKAGNYVPAWSEVTSKPSTFPPTIGATGSTAVAGNDPRLTDSRTPTAHTHATSEVTGLDTALAGKAASSHTHPVAGISDSTAVGRSVVTATDAAAARTAIGAGTSSLALGTTSVTAKAGDYQPTWAQVTSKPSTFAPVVGAGAADAKPGNWVPGVADLPAGSTLTVRYSGSWPARPTSRTDVTVFWVGSATAPAGALAGDVHFKDMA